MLKGDDRDRDREAERCEQADELATELDASRIIVSASIVRTAPPANPRTNATVIAGCRQEMRARSTPIIAIQRPKTTCASSGGRRAQAARPNAGAYLTPEEANPAPSSNRPGSDLAAEEPAEVPSVLMGEVHFNSGRRVGKSRVRAEHTRGTRRDVSAPSATTPTSRGAPTAYARATAPLEPRIGGSPRMIRRCDACMARDAPRPWPSNYEPEGP